ncbi:hypothetical protein AB0O68_21460 [Streptomyces sp. NPDC087512]|uniref:hypothetical protein n=1 Tax=Streptomyces sp. NPDC087512 TaxID=3155059 RepID=UPI00341D339C
MAKMATLVDAFTSFHLAGGPWNFSYGPPSPVPGRIHLRCVSTYEGLLTGSTYDLTDSSLLAEMVFVPTGGGGTRHTMLRAQIDGNDYIELGCVGDRLHFRQNSAGTLTTWESTAYDAAAHRWWRLTHVTGTGCMAWVSPDGVTWTRFGVPHSPSIELTAMHVHVFCGYYGTETSPPDAVVANVNNPPVLTNAPAGAVTATGRASDGPQPGPPDVITGSAPVTRPKPKTGGRDPDDGPRFGQYGGYGSTGVTNLDAVEALVGRSVEIASDYLPHDSWSWFDRTRMRTEQLDGWRAWRDSRPGSGLAYGVPVLTDPSTGDFAKVVAGAYDTYFTAAADALVESGNGDAVVRLGWEPNNPGIGSWQATSDPTGYVNAFRHIVTLFRGRPGARFLFELSSAVGPSGSITTFDDYYPGNSYVDLIGLNVYDVWWGGTVPPATRWTNIRTAGMSIDAVVAFAASKGKRLVCSEWGLYGPGDAYNGGGDDPYYIDRMYEYFRDNDLYYQCYFNWDWGGGVLADFPNGQAEYVLRFAPS